MIRFPSARPESVQDFEDRYKVADNIQNSLKQGDIDQAVSLQNRYQMNMDRLKGVDKAIQNVNATIQKVYQVPDIDPTQKRQLIDSMMFEMVSMAKGGNRLMDEFEKKKRGN